MMFVPTICNRCEQKRERTPAGTKHGACGGIFVTRIESTVSVPRAHRIELTPRTTGGQGLLSKKQ